MGVKAGELGHALTMFVSKPGELISWPKGGLHSGQGQRFNILALRSPAPLPRPTDFLAQTKKQGPIIYVFPKDILWPVFGYHQHSKLLSWCHDVLFFSFTH